LPIIQICAAPLVALSSSIAAQLGGYARVVFAFLHYSA